MAAALYPPFVPTYHSDQHPAIDPTQQHLDCSDKIVLITGGGTGIGQAIAVAFAQAHAKGIALLGRTRSTLEETATKISETCATTDIFITTADITSEPEVRTAFDQIITHYNTVPSILINNAGGLADGLGSLIDVDINAFWSSFELNTKGPLIVSQTFLRSHRTHNTLTTIPRKTLINITTGASHIPYFPTGASYATSKLASAKITEYIHYEHPEWNVFNLQPGVVATEMARKAGRKAPDSPRLAAGMCVWLSKDPRARGLSGRFLWANWDVEEVVGRGKEVRERGLLLLGLRGFAEGVGDEELIRRAESVHRNAQREVKE